MKDIIINRSRISKSIFFTVLIFLSGICLYSIWKADVKNLLIFGVFLIGWYFIYKRQPKRIQSLIKINEERLWIRNRGNKYWKSIICNKFRYERHRNYMDIYISNDTIADEEIDLHEVDMPVWWLKRILRKHVRVENH